MLGRNGTGMSQCRSVLIKENEFTVERICWSFGLKLGVKECGSYG